MGQVNCDIITDKFCVRRWRSEVATRAVCQIMRTKMKPTLVVLAAGMGSRYGGLKQVDPVGPSGEAILDYSVFDAIRGGFGKVVFIIRHDFEAEFKEKVGKKYEGMIPVDYCYQDLNDLPPPSTLAITSYLPTISVSSSG